MQDEQLDVTGGVDTHGEQHVAAVVGALGRILGGATFAATAAGYRRLLAWMRFFGRVARVGVEGTGSYGAGLARHLAAEGVAVVEVDRPNRQTRRRRGKSDATDAEAAARAALNGEATGAPKTGDGPVEAIRSLRVARRSAMKARTQAANQIRDLIVTALTSCGHVCVIWTPTAGSRCARGSGPPRCSTRWKRPRRRCAAWPAGTRRSVPSASSAPPRTPRCSPPEASGPRSLRHCCRGG